MKKLFSWFLIFTTFTYSNIGLVSFVNAGDDATSSAVIEVSPAPTEIPQDILEPTVTPTAEITPSSTVAPTPIPSMWTFEKVELNKEYIAPENTGVKLTFTKLPDVAGNIKIEEITLTEEQIQQTRSLSEKAYDITSDMVDGSFSYNLTLPIPESSKGKNVEVKFAEDISDISSAEKIDSSFLETDTSVSVNSLDHFTIFVVTNPNPVVSDCSNATFTVSIGDVCFNTIQAAVDAASSSAVISIKNGIYLENLILNKFGISLIGESRDGVIIRNPVTGSDSVGITVQANGILIKNLTVREFADGISLSDIDGFVSDGNLISDNSYSIPSGIHILDSKNINIKNNEFKNNSVAIDLSESVVGAVENILLTNNKFSENLTNLVNNVQSNISDATSNDWGSSDIDEIEGGIVHSCDANRYLHGICNIEDLSSDFGSVKYSNISSPSFTLPVCSSLTNQSAVTPTWNNVPGANVSYDVERTSPTNLTTHDSSPFNMNADGIWKWRIKATAGSQDSDYSSYCEVTYDATAPTNPGVPGTLSPTRALVQSWFWEGSTDSLSGLKDYSWFITGGSSGSSTSNSLTTFLAQGAWNLNIIANDNAGNNSATVSGALIVDRSSPNVSANGSISTWYTINPDITLSVADVGDSLVYISKYNWDFAATDTTGTDFVDGQIINMPSEGEHTLYLYTVDFAGNSSTWFGTYKLDTQNPVVSSNNSSALWVNSIPSILVSASDIGSGLALVKYAWNSLASSGTLTSNGADLVSTLVEGDQILNLYVEDVAGRSASSSGQYRLDTTKPAVSWATPTANSTISGTVLLSVNATDNLSGIDSIVYKFAPEGSSEFTIIPTNNWDTALLSLGKYILRATVTDKARNVINVDENVYVAAVITSFKHFTIDTNRIQIDWTTDRPTDGRVVYDRSSRQTIAEYLYSSGTQNSAPNYSTSHSIVISGLSAGTYYHFRAVSAGTPVVISIEESDRTFSEAVPSSNSSSDSSVYSTPVSIVKHEQVAGVETEVVEITPTLTPTPAPQVEGISTNAETPDGFNWWLLLIPAGLLSTFLLWLARRTRN